MQFSRTEQDDGMGSHPITHPEQVWSVLCVRNSSDHQCRTFWCSSSWVTLLLVLLVLFSLITEMWLKFLLVTRRLKIQTGNLNDGETHVHIFRIFNVTPLQCWNFISLYEPVSFDLKIRLLCVKLIDSSAYSSISLWSSSPERERNSRVYEKTQMNKFSVLQHVVLWM